MVVDNRRRRLQGSYQPAMLAAIAIIAAAKYIADAMSQRLFLSPSGQQGGGRVERRDVARVVSRKQGIGDGANDLFRLAFLTQDAVEQPCIVEGDGRMIGQAAQGTQGHLAERTRRGAFDHDDAQCLTMAAYGHNQPAADHGQQRGEGHTAIQVKLWRGSPSDPSHDLFYLDFAQAAIAHANHGSQARCVDGNQASVAVGDVDGVG